MSSNYKGKKIYVGMSGGVDSSVSAALLQQAGADVTGVFIKVWQPEGVVCTWKEERLDAMRVCAHLDIPFITLDAEAEYKKEVIDYMIDEYRNGTTPNPDVMCNKYVKFGAFLQWAKSQGADYVATGHYAQNILSESGIYELHVGIDDNKDQSYFLYQVKKESLPSILFPVGGIEKAEVRTLAEKFNLPVATKKDSQGLCFIGKVDMKDFLKGYIEEKRGSVLDTNGEIIGHHEGAMFYTLGERHSFVIDKKSSSDIPLFVIDKDIENNTLTVGEKAITGNTQREFNLRSVNWLIDSPKLNTTYSARVRYRGDLREITIVSQGADLVSVIFEHADNTASRGQSIVIYDGTLVIGGGIIV